MLRGVVTNSQDTTLYSEFSVLMCACVWVNKLLISAGQAIAASLCCLQRISLHCKGLHSANPPYTLALVTYLIGVKYCIWRGLSPAPLLWQWKRKESRLVLAVLSGKSNRESQRHACSICIKQLGILWDEINCFANTGINNAFWMAFSLKAVLAV